MIHNCGFCRSGLLPDEPLGRCTRCGCFLCEVCTGSNTDLCRECISAVATAYADGFVAAIQMDSGVLS